MELSPQQQTALDGILSSIGTSSLHFVTGKAGTGKSVLLRELRARAEAMCKTAVAAPTGTAALNVDGVTLHRLCGMRQQDNVTTVSNKRARGLNGLKLLIIDEVSMVRADMLDAVDIVLRNSVGSYAGAMEPFGGVTVVIVGDPAQLPPVVTPHDRKFIDSRYESEFFFSSEVFKNMYAEGQVCFYELTKVFRQKEEKFIKVLNAIRSGVELGVVADYLNTKCGATEPSGTVLTATNREKDVLNLAALKRLPGDIHTFEMTMGGKQLDDWQLTAPRLLEVKVGSRVMCIKNQYEGGVSGGGLNFGGDLLHANGDMGEVVAIAEESGVSPRGLVVRFDRTGDEMFCGPYTWDEGYNEYDPKEGRVRFKKLATCTQVPFVLADAMTIHKSQGKTIDECCVDVRGRTAQAGMLYTALSRATSLDGLKILGELKEKSFAYNGGVVEFNRLVKERNACILEDTQPKISISMP